MTIEKKGDIMAKRAWDSHELTQNATLAQEVRVRLLSEEVVEQLRYYSGAGAPETGVYLDKQHGSVGITVNPDSPWTFCRSGGIRQIIFETNQYQDLGDRNLRRFVIRGRHPEDADMRWETEFIIGGVEIRKIENNQQFSFEKADAMLILMVLGGIKDQIESLKLRR